MNYCTESLTIAHCLLCSLIFTVGFWHNKGHISACGKYSLAFCTQWTDAHLSMMIIYRPSFFFSPGKVAVLVLVLSFKASPGITDSLPLEWIITPVRPLMWLWIRLVYCIFVGNLVPTFTRLHSWLHRPWDSQFLLPCFRFHCNSHWCLTKLYNKLRKSITNILLAGKTKACFGSHIFLFRQSFRKQHFTFLYKGSSLFTSPLFPLGPRICTVYVCVSECVCVF